MSDINRVILIVLDSVGAGELPDADKYNDKGANTLGHIFEQMDEDFVLENMGKLGLYNIVPSPYGHKFKDIIGCYGKMATLSPAKDTTAGHWELAGVVLDKCTVGANVTVTVTSDGTVSFNQGTTDMKKTS